MKVTRMQGTNRIILGISIIDAQMKQQRQIASIQREKDTLAKVMAITEDYLSLYSVDPETDHFIEYSSTGNTKSSASSRKERISSGLALKMAGKLYIRKTCRIS